MVWKVSVVTLAFLLAGCGGGTATPTEGGTDVAVIENDPSSRPGSAAVYRRIESEVDCVMLQREFDTAMTNVEARSPGDRLRDISLSYANAADSRMREVGCYG